MGNNGTIEDEYNNHSEKGSNNHNNNNDRMEGEDHADDPSSLRNLLRDDNFGASNNHDAVCSRVICGVIMLLLYDIWPGGASCFSQRSKYTDWQRWCVFLVCWVWWGHGRCDQFELERKYST